MLSGLSAAHPVLPQCSAGLHLEPRPLLLFALVVLAEAALRPVRIHQTSFRPYLRTVRRGRNIQQLTPFALPRSFFLLPELPSDRRSAGRSSALTDRRHTDRGRARLILFWKLLWSPPSRPAATYSL